MKKNRPSIVTVGHGGVLPAFQRKGGMQSGQYRTTKQRRQDGKREIRSFA